MKRRILLLCLLTTLLVTACGGNQNGSSKNSSVDEPSPAADDGQEAASPSDSSQSGGNMEGSGDLGDYHVEIKEALCTEDYEGNPAIVITYSWTNNSEETTSAMVAMHEKAFQDGVGLDTAIIMDSSVYDSGAGMKDVRPGTTIDVQCAFSLTSETSTVEFEISELISFSNDCVVMNFDPASM